MEWNRLDPVSKWQKFGSIWLPFLPSRSKWVPKMFHSNLVEISESLGMKSIEPGVKMAKIFQIFDSLVQVIVWNGSEKCFIFTEMGFPPEYWWMASTEPGVKMTISFFFFFVMTSILRLFFIFFVRLCVYFIIFLFLQRWRDVNDIYPQPRLNLWI